MKEELQDKLVEILGSIQTAAGKASDFALDQLPDIAQSYVAYGRAYTTFIIVLTLTVTALFIAFGRSFEKDMGKCDRGFPTFLACMASVLPMGFFAGNLNSFFLVWVAPKVWLLKEIAGLIHK